VVVVGDEPWGRVGAKGRRAPLREGIRAVGDGRGGESWETGRVRSSAVFTLHKQQFCQDCGCSACDPFTCGGSRKFFFDEDEVRRSRSLRRCSLLERSVSAFADP
jgi:hypothetical protein